MLEVEIMELWQVMLIAVIVGAIVTIWSCGRVK